MHGVKMSQHLWCECNRSHKTTLMTNTQKQSTRGMDDNTLKNMVGMKIRSKSRVAMILAEIITDS